MVRVPKVAKSVGIDSRRLGDYYIMFRDCHTISDLELLDREEHVIGPCNNRTYMIPWNDATVLRGRVKFIGSPYVATEIPLGAVGMVLKPLRVSPNYTFFDGCSLCDTQKKLLSVMPSHKEEYNFYLVYCTEQLDAFKSGYYLLPIDSVKPFDQTRTIGLKNFHIYDVHSKQRLFE